MDRKLQIGLIFLLFIVLALNIYTLSKVNTLYEKVNAFQNNLTALKNELNGSINGIRNVVEDIRAEERWITPVKMEIGERDGEFQKVVFTWQVKEVSEGSEVIFYYRRSGDTEYNSVKAEKTGGNSYEAEISIPLDVEPDFSVSWSDDVRGSKNAVKIVKEEHIKDLTYSYYISVKDGDKMLSNEEAVVNLAKIKLQVYAPLQVSFSKDKNGVYRVMLIENRIVEPYHSITKAYLKIEERNGDSEKTSQKELKMVEEESGPESRVLVFEGNWESGDYQVEKVMLYVQYDNGKVFSKDITNYES